MPTAPKSNSAAIFSRTLRSVNAVFGRVFSNRLAYPRQLHGGNQDAKMAHLFQCDRTCGHSSININGGFRDGMGPNRSTASAAAICRRDETDARRICSVVYSTRYAPTRCAEHYARVDR